LSRAIAEFFDRNTKVAKQCHLKIGQRRVLGIDKVTPAFDGPGTSAYHKSRQRAVRMAITVADASSI
jgi:hypothetical protein